MHHGKRARKQATSYTAAAAPRGSSEPSIEEIVRQLYAEGLLEIVGYRKGQPVYRATSKRRARS
jgi:hypothetical protein